MTDVAAILSEPVAHSRRALLRTPIVTQVILACAAVSRCPQGVFTSALCAERYLSDCSANKRFIVHAARDACAYALQCHALLSDSEILTLMELRLCRHVGPSPLERGVRRGIRRQLMRDRA